MTAQFSRITVVLITTCSTQKPNSMLIYADMLIDVLKPYGHLIEIKRVDLLDLVPKIPFVREKINYKFQRLWIFLFAYFYLRKFKPDLFHLIDGSMAYVLNFISPEKCVTTLHDLIPLLQSRQLFPVKSLGFFARILIRFNMYALQKQRNICVDSLCTKNDALKYLENVTPLVIHPSIRQSILNFVPSKVPGWEDRQVNNLRTILHVGNGGFYKNRTTVVHVFSQLRSRFNVRLVFAGDSPDKLLEKLIIDLSVNTLVDFVPHPSDIHLSKLYLTASLLLFPSYYEGFGWPPLEAMLHGCPVVCSNAGSLPEVVDNAALMSSPHDIDGFVNQCQSILQSSAVATELIQLGFKNIERFSQKVMAEKMYSFYTNSVITD